MTKTLEFFKSKPVQNSLLFILLIVWCIGTLKNPYMNYFNTDEFHAGNIAKYLSFTEIIRLMKIEGHTFLWYMVLKPFTYYDDILFPSILKTINWLFMLLAVSLFLYKSRFNIFLKGLFIFSFPIFCLYPTFARCYSIGIFFLLIVSILYKDRLKHPLLFALMIFLTCNTSLMGTISVSGIALLFIIDLFKQRDKKIILPMTVLLCCALSLFIQWFDFKVPAYNNFADRTEFYLKIIFFTGIPIIIYSFRKYKSMIFYLLFASVTMIFISLFVYSTDNWHFMFLFIILAVAYQIFDEQTDNRENKIEKLVFCIYFGIVCISLSPMFYKRYFNAMPLTEYKKITSCIENTVPDNSTIYTDIQFFPLIKNKSYKYKTLYGCDIGEFNSFGEYWSKTPLIYDKIIKNRIVGARNINEIQESSYMLFDSRNIPKTNETNIDSENNFCEFYAIIKLK